MQMYIRKNLPSAVPVEAAKVTKENVSEVAEWCTGQEVEEIDALDSTARYVGINVVCWDGMKRASEGDYVIKDHLGDFHVRWGEIFDNQYEQVNDE